MSQSETTGYQPRGQIPAGAPPSGGSSARRPRATQSTLIASTPDILHGACCIVGTRVKAASVRRLHEDGYDGPATLREYPGLTEAEIAAAVEFYQKAKTARDACVSLRRSIQTASNDDYSKALTEKRRRHVARLAAMEAAIEEIKRLRTALEVIAGGDGDAQVIARQTLEAAA